jgi:hypothetical protein
MRCPAALAPCTAHAPLTPPCPAPQVHLAPFRLRWLAPDGAELAADRASCAYGFGQRSGAVLHAMARAPGDAYFGLGDKTGGLDLHGRRLRTVMTDAMGYDPQCARRPQPCQRCMGCVCAACACGQTMPASSASALSRMCWAVQVWPRRLVMCPCVCESAAP